MLVRLTPEQVAQGWDRLAPLIAESLPPMIPETRNGMKNILTAILMDQGIVWSLFEGDDMEKWMGLCLTYIDIDPMTRDRNLVIYAANAVHPLEGHHVKDALGTLRTHARNNECTSVIMYTTSDVLQRFMQRFEVRAHYHTIEITP